MPMPRAAAWAPRRPATGARVSPRSSDCIGTAGAPGSLRASVEQLLDQAGRPLDALPTVRASASRRVGLVGARSSSWTCSRSAVSGERSSCAASETKARCASNEPPRRASSALSASPAA
jgi:hypothetical protein